MSAPELRGGWWWPAADKVAEPVIQRDCDGAVAALLEHVQGRDCIVQAGANVGVYPVALAEHFARVVTAEPDADNRYCLLMNLAARDPDRRIEARAVAFGADFGLCRVVQVAADNCGAHRIATGGGAVAVVPIDSLELTACDAVWLDIEGHELPALTGARTTIERFRPVIAIEEKGLGAAYGLAPQAAGDWLSGLGYERVARIGRDNVYRSKS
jgi:FkbM family methyltransferase